MSENPALLIYLEVSRVVLMARDFIVSLHYIFNSRKRGRLCKNKVRTTNRGVTYT